MEDGPARSRPLAATSGLSGTALVIIWMLIILVLSLQPGTEELGARRFRLDVSSLGHAAFFAILAFLVASLVARHRVRRPWWWTIVLVTLFGILSELLQATVPLRTASMVDLIADVGGTLVGLAVFVVADRWTAGEPLRAALAAVVPRPATRASDGSAHVASPERNG